MDYYFSFNKYKTFKEAELKMGVIWNVVLYGIGLIAFGVIIYYTIYLSMTLVKRLFGLKSRTWKGKKDKETQTELKEEDRQF